MSEEESRRVLAHFDDLGVAVYQAFKPSTVRAAVAKGTFGAGFNLDRMTWIKPSLGWMLHRSEYATKHRMEAIAPVWLRHEGFLEILRQGVPTSFDPRLFESEQVWATALRRSDVRYQWDPDRDLRGWKLDRRAIQIGIRGETVRRYVEEWIIRVEDVAGLAQAIGRAVSERSKPLPEVPEEREYPLDEALRRTLGYSRCE
jgi:hypothetical protein